MTKTKAKLGLVPFDAADYLSDDAALAEFLSAALEDGDPDAFFRQYARQPARVACRNWRATPDSDGKAYTKC